MTILIECEQRSEEWFAARAGVCTASRFRDARAWTGGLDARQAAYVAALRDGYDEVAAAAAAGYKAKPSFTGLADALAGKRVGQAADAALRYAYLLAIERIAGEPLDSSFETWAMRRGAELEPVARERYMAETGYVVLESGLLLTDDRRFGYSTDGEVYGQPGGIEIKVPSAADKVAGVWIDPEPVIAEYLDQIDGGMWITGWRWIDLVVYTPWLASVGKDIWIHRIHRDSSRIEALELDLMRFTHQVDTYEAILRDQPPPPPYQDPAWASTTEVPRIDLPPAGAQSPAPIRPTATPSLAPCF